MSTFETAAIVEGYRSVCEDRVAVTEIGDRVVIVVADGAGGVGSGRDAAASVIEHTGNCLPDVASADGWRESLTQIDYRIACGQSTAVVVDLTPDGICGASVGDSQAWIASGSQLVDLTARQRRKPLLGSGEATPVGFNHPPLNGLLVAATDGFCNYVRRENMLKTLPHLDFPVIPKRLLEMVRLRSGELWDDVGIVVCRRRSDRPNPGRITLSLEDFA